ncbi:MAG: bifunctional 23S rRNA (guanine(2069)-N(7))-methyltransferase RlmK/23S rRNA (guanine(2445)-N(2))-methyltransferase RlmL [Panacagrimonas sp.]
MAESIDLFVTCPRGVEYLLQAELAQLGAHKMRERPGGVACEADLKTAYATCLWSRVASRVLMPLASQTIASADQLYQLARGIHWPALFTPKRSFAVEVAGKSAVISHSQFAGLRLKDAIVDGFRDAAGVRPDVDRLAPDVRIHLHLHRDQATISLDLAGEALHRRGWRQGSNIAPLKENLAAAILIRAGWPQMAADGKPLIDPMCGSGTLVIEAAMMAADIAPGLRRKRWGFDGWLGHQPGVWQSLLDQAHQRVAEGLPRLPSMTGSDVDGAIIRIAKRNAEAAGLGARIQWRRADFSTVGTVGDAPGLLVTNPPYGERLGSTADVVKLYSLLGASIGEHFGGWEAAIFSGQPSLGPRLGLRAHQTHTLFNGPIECKLLRIAVPDSSGSPSSSSQGADFNNRLRKNLRHLGKWAKRAGVSNYRVYDCDLPDYALAVDLYHTPQPQVHVQEYAAPKSVDPARAEKRLRLALRGLQSEMQLDTDALHYKLRAAQRGRSQYQANATASREFEVSEHGCRFWIKLDTYLDTGLFLDHRPLRLQLQQQAKGQRFLNLFCYTASASVHAARGGATQTVSVDLSKTYLEWAARNFELNRFSTYFQGRRDRPRSAPHQLIQADCLQWLEDAAASRTRFDLIFCDPPTFSNSKRTEHSFDVQRDHVALIERCAALLADDGLLYFSTNRRRFKFEATGSTALTAREITRETLDEDFRRGRTAHRCWEIRKTAEQSLEATTAASAVRTDPA